MRFRGIVTLAAAIVAAGCAYSVYAPETLEKLAPAAGAYARQLHGLLPEGMKAPGAPSARVDGRPAADGANARPAVLVSVVPVKRADYPVYLQSIGQVQAYNTVTVRARVDGQIMKIAFNEGQMVKAGDLLAQIDPRPFQAALDQADAKKTQDEANLANAKLDLQRFATLAKQDFATKQQLDTQNAMVLQLTGSIAADAAAIDAAQVAARLHDHPRADLRPRRVPPDRRGQSRHRRATDRDRVDRATAADRRRLRRAAGVCTRINQDAGRRRARGHGDGLRRRPKPRDRQTGRSATIRSMWRPGTIRLKAEFDNKDNELWPGLAVTTGLQLGVDKDVLIVPTEVDATWSRTGLSSLSSTIRTAPQLRQVKIAHQDTSTAVISEGLKEGDRVVTSGQFHASARVDRLDRTRQAGT